MGKGEKNSSSINVSIFVNIIRGGGSQRGDCALKAQLSLKEQRKDRPPFLNIVTVMLPSATEGLSVPLHLLWPVQQVQCSFVSKH